MTVYDFIEYDCYQETAKRTLFRKPEDAISYMRKRKEEIMERPWDEEMKILLERTEDEGLILIGWDDNSDEGWDIFKKLYIKEEIVY